ncbi:hypothetical protein M8J76_001297 [Diaphorina citri]|nr:hypothetical protein M8J75_002441 [Diaphorina citri]KAI5721938.1 hypothetical protein M8J76_001297 [Diaphorina citri]KAI5724797.1 hypothetical protein M8J77_007307 [Diaphorina citri]
MCRYRLNSVIILAKSSLDNCLRVFEFSTTRTMFIHPYFLSVSVTIFLQLCSACDKGWDNHDTSPTELTNFVKIGDLCQNDKSACERDFKAYMRDHLNEEELRTVCEYDYEVNMLVCWVRRMEFNHFSMAKRVKSEYQFFKQNGKVVFRGRTCR